jgi:hypothetical protein
MLMAVLGLVAGSGIAHAQSAMNGVVRDTSGAVLPGVTVEASSDVLIEKSKSAITDGEGRYSIPDLRPGVYVVTFSLEGFSSIRREGIELPSEFTMTLNADLRVGALEESITVTGSSPVVDVTTAAHNQVLNREAVDNIPTGRTIQGLGQLVVGINLSLPDTGGARAMQQTYMSTHGMTTSNTTVMADGMMINGLQSDGAVQTYTNDAMYQEISYQTSGINADTQAGGVRLNMIPREGGNRFSGSFATSYRPGDWQGSNLTQRHVDRGLTAGNATDRIIDYTLAQGGPIKKDKLWFFGSARYFSVNNFIAGTFFDDGSQGIDDQFIKSANIRLTYQISQKVKFSGYFDEIDKFRGHDMQSGYDPETAAVEWNSPAYHTAAAKITSPITSRLLIEGGYSNNTEDYTNEYQPGIEKPRFSQEWYRGINRTEQDIPGFQRKDAAQSQTTQSPLRYAVNASASYVTGSHNMKFGFQRTWGHFNHTVDANGDLYQIYQSGLTNGGSGVPYTRGTQVVVRNTPVASGELLNQDLGIYGQDSWTVKRLTVNAGIRWERLNAQVAKGTSPAGRFVPAREFAEIDNLPDWKSDWAPRFAMVYDLFGNAKTAVKYSLNKYNLSRTTGIADSYNPLASTTQALPWTDLNGDDVAQGDSVIVGGRRVSCVYLSAGCEINFANLGSTFGTVSLNTYGNYPRTYNVEHGLELQHELMPRLSLAGSWYHGSFSQLTTTINRALQFDGDPAKNPYYTSFTIYDPRDGTPITAYGLNANATASFRPTDNLETEDPNRGSQYNAFNVEFKARPGGGAQVFGGMSVERQLLTNCTSPDNPNTLRFCDDTVNNLPWRKTFKAAGSYPLPYGILFSASFQSNQPAPPTTNATTTNMTFTRGTTRYPAGCPAPCPAGQIIGPSAIMNQTTLTVALQPPQAFFNERITQFDLKVSKTFKFNRVSVLPTFEMFNVNNSDAIISYQSLSILSAQYLAPNSIMQPRMIGIGAQVKW